MRASIAAVSLLWIVLISVAIAAEQGTGEKTTPPARNPRVLLITTKDSPRCDQELARLNRAGGDFEKLRSSGWKIGEGSDKHLQIVDRDAAPDFVKQIEIREYPTVICIDKEEIIRSFTSGCTTPLDMWTFGFLAKGIDERPPGVVPEKARVETTGNYRLRGNHWSVDGDWNPTRETVVSHLRGPNHGSHILISWQIERWSYEELRSLHDDLHEQEGGGNYASHSSSSRGSQLGAGRKIAGAY